MRDLKIRRQEMPEPVLFTQVHSRNVHAEPVTRRPGHSCFHYKEGVLAIWQVQKQRQFHSGPHRRISPDPESKARQIGDCAVTYEDLSLWGLAGIHQREANSSPRLCSTIAWVSRFQ